MKKRIFSFVAILLLCLTLAVPVSAADLPRMVDVTGTLSSTEVEVLNQKLDEVSSRLQFDVVIVIIDSLGGAHPEDMANDIWREYHYGYGPEAEGAILLLSMEYRDWAITTSEGFGDFALSEEGRNHVASVFTDNLHDENYAYALDAYIDECDKLITSAREGKAYRDPFPLLRNFGISLAVSLIIAVIYTGVLSSQLKSVASRLSAGNYIKAGSMHLTESRDLFLYHTVNRVPRPKNNSSGGSHGGGGRSGSSGKF